jgi:guanosine-3',5'-bis(diphosphate) 3'-pyrophosphohydrolase
MTPSSMLARAIALAATAHQDQTDKAGRPYILHTLKVMHYLRSDDDELMAIAVLHDVVEDTRTTYADLRTAGLSERIVAGVQSMTKQRGQTADEYLAQVLSNPDAVRVKMADLRHNSDIRRLKGVTEKDIRRIEKYNRMYELLKQHIHSKNQ